MQLVLLFLLDYVQTSQSNYLLLLLVRALTMLEQEVNLCWDEATPLPFLFLYSCSQFEENAFTETKTVSKAS